MKPTSLIISLLLIAMMFLGKDITRELAITNEAGILDYHRVTYMLVHANVLHLLVNLYGFLSMVFLCKATTRHFLLAIMIAATIPNVLLSATPMCGMSALNFALTGLVVARTKRKIFLIGINLLIILPTIFISSVAVCAHLYGLIVGFIIGLTSGALFRSESCASPHKTN